MMWPLAHQEPGYEAGKDDDDDEDNDNDWKSDDGDGDDNMSVRRCGLALQRGL